MTKFHIGLDMGTSSIKAVLLEDAACIRKEASVSYDVDMPHEGWREIDPERWYQAAVQAVQTLMEGIDPSNVRGIGITGQMHTTVFLDQNGRSIRPAILWNDRRSGDLLPGLHAQMKQDPALASLISITTTGSPAASLYWLRHAEPAHFALLHTFVIGPDELVRRLTGVVGTDYCESSTSALVDLTTGQWSEHMCTLVGLQRAQLPQIRGAAQIAGGLIPEAAAAFGLPTGLPVIVGTGDNPAAAIPTGVLTEGRTVISLGTSGVLMVRKSKPELNAKGKNVLFSLDGKTISCLCQGVLQATGNAYGWWIKDILRIPDFSGIDAQIVPWLERTTNTLFFPYLTGDKTLYQDAALRGAFLNLSTETTREELTYAVLEGLSLGFRALRDQMNIPRDVPLQAVGGGAQSDVWVQTLADVLNTPVTQQTGQTGAGLGAALLSAWADGTITDVKAFTAGQSGRTFHPRPERAQWFDRKYTWFSRIYGAYKTIYQA